MMSVRSWLAVVSLGMLALSACGDSEDAPASTTTTVARFERTWVDPSRATPRTSAFPGAMTRTLRTVIWEPDAGPALPLLVMAHGFGGLPEKFDALARSVAAAGFVVAAPAFPLTNANAPGGHDLGLRDFIHQPGDVSFIITQLLAAAAGQGDPLFGRIRVADIAVLGHSLGGVTAIGLTRKDCCRDTRVHASILVAAVLPLADAFGIDPITEGPPTMILQGTADQSVPYITATNIYDLIAPPRFLVGIAGAGHSEDVESQLEPPIPARDAAQRATIAFLNAEFRGAQHELDATLQALAAQGHIVQ